VKQVQSNQTKTNQSLFLSYAVCLASSSINCKANHKQSLLLAFCETRHLKVFIPTTLLWFCVVEQHKLSWRLTTTVAAATLHKAID